MAVIAHPARPDLAAGGTVTPATGRYAGFWRRAMAAGIDSVLMFVLMLGILFATGPFVGQVNDTVTLMRGGKTILLADVAKPDVVVTRNGPTTVVTETTTATFGLQTVRSIVTRTTYPVGAGGHVRTDTASALTVTPSALGFALFFGLWLVYMAGCEASRMQGSLGKRMMLVRVGDEQGQRLSLGHALGRNVLKLVSAAPLLAGFVMAAFTAKKQALHDMLAGCTLGVR